MSLLYIYLLYLAMLLVFAIFHLLDFHQNIYDKEVSVAFYKKIRSEKRFNSIDELIEQLNKDVEVTREYFR